MGRVGIPICDAQDTQRDVCRVKMTTFSWKRARWNTHLSPPLYW